MKLGIGIDTGGTCTDAVVYDFDTNKVLAFGKALTTKWDLSEGIGEALDALPRELLQKADIVALSTTLATNACVEHKGGRAKLVLLSTTREVLEWIDAKHVYGLDDADVLCIDTASSFDGKVVDNPDWDAVLREHEGWFSDAQALAVAEVNAPHNGAACEKCAKQALSKRFNVPLVMASELAGDLNVMERGATALLNARLLPTIDSFTSAVEKALKKRGVAAGTMTVRSDGSLMSRECARSEPVNTILSGPAASVIGGRGLTKRDNCLVIDMGGTTTDIAIVRDSAPKTTTGIRIGGFRTQIKGVLIDTFALGGDTRMLVSHGALSLDDRRVQPICAAASKYPEIKDGLKALLKSRRTSSQPLHELLYLESEPEKAGRYSEEELRLVEKLKDGPVLLAGGELDIYNLKSERLENEGVVMRCGFTPTDVMHITKDFCRYDAEASQLAARYLVRSIPGCRDTAENLRALCDKAYDLVRLRLYENIVRVLIADRYPKLLEKGMDAQLLELVRSSWYEKQPSGLFNLDFVSRASLVGIGAPTHVFLKEVAERLGAECVIPADAGVANAVGAVLADVSAEEDITVSPDYTADGLQGYSVYAPSGKLKFKTLEQALERAGALAEEQALNSAKRRGAPGEVTVSVKTLPNTAYTSEGMPIDLGTVVRATASCRIR